MDMERRGSEPFVEPSYMLQSPNYGYEVLNRLNVLRTESCFTDAILCVGQEEFHCHRNVLAVSSPYFKAMFSCDLREGKEGKIVFNELSPWTMKRVIEYAYTGKVEITVDNAQDLLAVGNMFQYQEIVDACCQFLSRHLHPSNCFGIEEFAHLHDCSQLETEAHQFTLDNFTVSVEFDEFLTLPFARLVSFLASDLIDVRTEETVYEAALRWIHHDLDERKHFTCDVMDRIRFATVDVQYLEDKVHPDLHIQGCERCSGLIEDAKRYHETKTEKHGQRRRSMQTETFTPRPSTLAKEAMVLLGGLDTINYIMQSMEVYDPLKDKWNPLPDMPRAASWFSASAVNNDIYVSGGIVDSHIVPTVWRFEAMKRRWCEVTPMLTPRAHHTSTTYNDKLYIFGGIQLIVNSKLEPVESIECYDTQKQQWSVVGRSPFPRKQSHVVPYNETFVEIGGLQGDVEVQTMESYLCNGTDVTYTGEQFVLPECIQHAQIVVINRIFYIIWENSKRMISLNPEKRTYRWLRDMHYAHLHCGATVLQGKVYVSGGLVDSKPSRIVECYDPTTNLWTLVKSTRHPRACHGCVTIQMCSN